MKLYWMSFVFLFMLILTGCGPASVESAAAPAEAQEAASQPVLSVATPASPAQGDTTQMPPSSSTPAASGLENFIEKAKADLAQRLSISATQISLKEAKAVVWPDASMGCPQPGMSYKQVPADGASIVLQVGETVYEYHVGGSRGLFLCEKAYKDPNPPPKIDIFNLTPPSSGKNKPIYPTPDNSIPPGENQ
jgi:hypothetical protein